MAVSIALAGCGGAESDKSSRLVDPKPDPPINSLGVETGSGDLLLTTNRGFFRIRDGRAKRIAGAVDTDDGTSPVGTFLAFRTVGDGRLLGSGHPDRKGRVADFLGLMRSRDGGRHWATVSRYGIADLHVIRTLHDRIYAFDAVLGAVLVGDEEGKDWSEHPTPPGQVLDLVVDPEDADHLLISNSRDIFGSDDGGKSWRPLASGVSARMAWPSAGELFRADQNGLVYRSADHGNSWEDVGKIDGEPWKLEADGPDRLLAALSDATIVESTDGGESWKEIFKP